MEGTRGSERSCYTRFLNVRPLCACRCSYPRGRRRYGSAARDEERGGGGGGKGLEGSFYNRFLVFDPSTTIYIYC